MNLRPHAKPYGRTGQTWTLHKVDSADPGRNTDHCIETPDVSPGFGLRQRPSPAGRYFPTYAQQTFDSQLRLFFVYIFLILTGAVARSATTNATTLFQPITPIDGTPRGTNFDLVQLANGESLRGTVVDQSLTLHTAYGSTAFKIDWLADLVVDQPADHLDRLDTVNRNRFSGFLDGPVTFRNESGETVSVNKFEIRRIIFHRRETESDHGATRRFFVLDGGDFFSGQPRDWNPESREKNGTPVPDLDAVEMVQFAGATRNLKLLLRDGQETSAILTNDVLKIELDLGPEIMLPVSQLKTMFARSGSLPEPVRREFEEDDTTISDRAAGPPAPTPDGMVWIKPGHFQMGSYPGEQGHASDEVPPTEVILTHGFWMGKYEVTQEEYVAVMGVNPSGFQGQTNHPVEKVTWNEANTYCEKLTGRERAAGRLPAGFVYRLPTEAEWEYACRAGTTTRFSFGDDPANTELARYGWFIVNSDSTTHPVGRLRPNPWGLYDMHGNVWEWCHDLWQDTYPGGTVTDYAGPTDGWLRVARGGSWLYDAAFCRSANRDDYGPDNRCSDIGFRVVLARPL